MLLALLLPLAAQDPEIIRRTDRGAYEQAIELCRKAEAAIPSEPAKAVELLTDLIENRPLRKMECFVRIEVFANAPDPPVALVPWQLRGRARMGLAKAGGPDRRKLLEQAIGDFETSAAKGMASSAAPARAARTELLALLQQTLDPAINELLARMEGDRQAAEVEAFAAGLSRDAAAAAVRIEELERSPGSASERQAGARRELAWCDAATAALAGLKAGSKARADLLAARDRATVLAAFRGRVRLKISASPYAEVEVLRRDGNDVPLRERLTPLVLEAPVEIGELEVVLVHPAAGRRSRRFPADAFRDGATYVLSADMEKDVLTLTPLP